MTRSKTPAEQLAEWADDVVRELPDATESVPAIQAYALTSIAHSMNAIHMALVDISSQLVEINERLYRSPVS